MSFIPKKTKREFIAQLENEGADVLTAKMGYGVSTLDYTLACGTRKIRYHDTDIVTFNTNGSIKIDTGGYNTITTRKKINQYLPSGMGVYTEKSVIHVYYGKCWDGNKRLGTPFKNVAIIDAKGKLTVDIQESEISNDMESIRSFMRYAKDNGLPSIEESRGDPWVISMSQLTKEMVKEWVKEKYLTRRMLALALEHREFTDAQKGYIFHMSDRDGIIPQSGLNALRSFIKSYT